MLKNTGFYDNLLNVRTNNHIRISHCCINVKESALISKAEAIKLLKDSNEIITTTVDGYISNAKLHNKKTFLLELSKSIKWIMENENLKFVSRTGKHGDHLYVMVFSGIHNELTFYYN